MSSSSSSLSVSSSDPPLTGMDLGFQNLEERIIATTTCTNTHVRVPPIIGTIGCDITIEDIQSVKKELLNQGVDLKKDVIKSQRLRWDDNMYWTVTPLIHFCRLGNLPIVRLLFLIGADCTKLDKFGWFPMFVAARGGHFDICKWLFEYGGDAKYQINKETSDGRTPLQQSYMAWLHGKDKEGKTCRWLLRNGGGQHLSPKAMRGLRITDGKEETNSNLLVLWIRKNIQLHNTFILLLCGVTTMITSSSSLLSSLEPNDGGTRKCKRQRLNQERSLQILDGCPGIMELIGNYVGVIRGTELRMLKEFNELVIEYNRDESDDDDDDY